MNRQKYPRLLALGLTLALLVALLAFFARAASAQDFDVPQDSTIRLTLGDAVRLAAQQNADGRERAQPRRRGEVARDAEPRRPAAERCRRRVVERGTHFQQRGTVPDRLPVAPGQPPLFDPARARSSGRSNVLDARARLRQSIYDPACDRSRSAARRRAVPAATPTSASPAEVAAHGGGERVSRRAARRRGVQRAPRRFDAGRRAASDRAGPAAGRHGRRRSTSRARARSSPARARSSSPRATSATAHARRARARHRLCRSSTSCSPTRSPTLPINGEPRARRSTRRGAPQSQAICRPLELQEVAARQQADARSGASGCRRVALADEGRPAQWPQLPADL